MHEDSYAGLTELVGWRRHYPICVRIQEGVFGESVRICRVLKPFLWHGAFDDQLHLWRRWKAVYNQERAAHRGQRAWYRPGKCLQLFRRCSIPGQFLVACFAFHDADTDLHCRLSNLQRELQSLDRTVSHLHTPRGTIFWT